MYSILYVDDDENLLNLNKIFMEKSGEFLIDTVSSAPEALEMIATARYDAILSDYQMPEMDGIEFLKTRPYPAWRPAFHPFYRQGA